MRYPYSLLDVFTDQPFCGNPLAVFPAAQGLSDAQMQRIAAELGLSETAFCFPPSEPGATARLRIFPPATELPFAGHPTVGAAVHLVSSGAVALEGGRATLLLEERAGMVGVVVTGEPGGGLSAQLTAPTLPRTSAAPLPAAALAAMLGLADDDLLEGAYAPRTATAGLSFTVVTVRGTEALARIRWDTASWERLLAGVEAAQLYVVAVTGNRRLRARMFAPAWGVDEDPATGAAATVLAAYLLEAQRPPDGTACWTVEQGVEMGRPSVLRVEADVSGGRLTAVRVGGSAVQLATGVFDVPGG